MEDIKKLIATEKIKRKSNYPCKKCGINVLIGEKYISVKYNDTFIIRPYGVFHLSCWGAQVSV